MQPSLSLEEEAGTCMSFESAEETWNIFDEQPSYDIIMSTPLPSPSFEENTDASSFHPSYSSLSSDGSEERDSSQLHMLHCSVEAPGQESQSPQPEAHHSPDLNRDSSMYTVDGSLVTLE